MGKILLYSITKKTIEKIAKHSCFARSACDARAQADKELYLVRSWGCSASIFGFTIALVIRANKVALAVLSALVIFGRRSNRVAYPGCFPESLDLLVVE